MTCKWVAITTFFGLLTLALLISASCHKDQPCTTCPPNGADTTSHNFVWHLDTLGDCGSSILRDVAIVNDSLVFAVGEIYKHDSIGNREPSPYNLAAWNGHRWELMRVTVMFRGSLITPPIYGINMFSVVDMWLAAGLAIHGHPSSWVAHDVRAITGYDTLSFTTCWGQNSSNIYFVGLRGSLAHYDGGTWRRLESTTSVNINDIEGLVEPNGRSTILLTTSNRYSAGEKKLLSVNPTGGVDSLAWSPGTRLNTVWFASTDRLFVGGDAGIQVGLDRGARYPCLVLHTQHEFEELQTTISSP